MRSIRATGLPYFIINGDEQEGCTFGEKFTNAFQTIFEKGYDKVIALGNDHPCLQSSTIQKAATSLGQHPHVIGPAKDGGLYLIGIQKSSFAPTTFQNLPWQTSHLHQAYEQLAQEQGNYPLTLQMLRDADSAHQFRSLLNDLKGQLANSLFFKKLISLIGQHLFLVTPQRRVKPSPQVLATCSMRGPPSDHS